jgi:hypothetical protein
MFSPCGMKRGVVVVVVVDIVDIVAVDVSARTAQIVIIISTMLITDRLALNSSRCNVVRNDTIVNIICTHWGQK